MIPGELEQTRQRIYKALTRAKKSILDKHQLLGIHLKNAITHDDPITYHPEEPIDWDVYDPEIPIRRSV